MVLPEVVPGEGIVEVVVKLGGGTLEHPKHFDAALAAIRNCAKRCRLLIVPGGGPFADTVREVDRRFGLCDDTAHWMAVLAMDQFAHFVAARLADGELVAEPTEVAGVLSAGRMPVLAPSRWLVEADPLPHAWTVTSDSIAAWVAGRVGAKRLVLVKPPGAVSGDLVDVYFHQALPAHVRPVVVSADQMDALHSALCGER